MSILSILFQIVSNSGQPRTTLAGAAAGHASAAAAVPAHDAAAKAKTQVLLGPCLRRCPPNCTLNRLWKLHWNKKVVRVHVILSGLIDYANQMKFRSGLVR